MIYGVNKIDKSMIDNRTKNARSPTPSSSRVFSSLLCSLSAASTGHALLAAIYASEPSVYFFCLLGLVPL